MKLEQTLLELSKKDEGREESVIFMNKEIEELKASLEKYKEEELIDRSRLVKLERKCKGLESMDEVRETHSRKMNLWVFGVEQKDEKEEPEDTWLVVKKFAIIVLELDEPFLDQCIIKNTHRLGKKENKERPIIIAFVKWEDRMKFLKAASSLYSYNKKNNTRYGVKTDLAPKARELRKAYHDAAVRWRQGEEGIIIRPCNNDKGKVWMEIPPNCKKNTKKPIRIFSKGCHAKTLSVLKECLDEDHKIHYTNAEMDMVGEALELLIHFNNSFVGISKKNLSLGNPGLDMVRRLSLSKMVPYSYAYTNLDGGENK